MSPDSFQLIRSKPKVYTYIQCVPAVAQSLPELKFTMYTP